MTPMGRVIRLLLFLPLVLAGCSSPRPEVEPAGSRQEPSPSHKRPEESGKLTRVSFYGVRDGMSGRMTAAGERFDPKELTAAHRTLPFGTNVKITNPSNGKSVVVRINDRGPFIKGREYDLSFAAARELGIVQKGEAEVMASVQ